MPKAKLLKGKPYSSRKNSIARGAKKSVTELEKSGVKPRVVRELDAGHFTWHSTGKNWQSEFRRRLVTGNFDPYTNPKTGTSYTAAALNYREKFLKITQKPAKSVEPLEA